MVKKGYNWKSRQVKKTIIDETTTKSIQLDLPIKGHYDGSNELVLPSAKRKTKTKNEKAEVIRILSKKHRRRLEKIVEKKKKKENRASLLEALSQVQAPPDVLNQLTSIASIQTKGLKRYFHEEVHGCKPKKPKRDLDIISGEVKLNSLSGAKRRALLKPENDSSEVQSDPNIVGFYESADESDSNQSENDNLDKKGEVVQMFHQLNSNNDSTSGPLGDLGGKNPEEIKIESVDDEICDLTTSNSTKKKQVVHMSQVSKTDSKSSSNESGASWKKTKVVQTSHVSGVVERAVYVDVTRVKEVQEERLKLPILAEEQVIMETIKSNAITIVAGETGSGKTTQVPQFLYEAGYALNKMIAVTEPRRVAAISMSQRIAHEMNVTAREVSYLIRFEGNATDDTKIKFMTDGVLLKECQRDFLLSKYSAVILDEAHERSVYTDILIGLLSRIVPLRAKRGDPLKLVIMSATLRLEDFVDNRRLFKCQPPVIKIDSRQFPVTIHFNRKTNDDYLKECFGKVVKVHTKLPEGGVLVFVTGQQEVNYLVKKLRKTFPYSGDKSPRQQKSGKKGRGSEVKRIPAIDLDDFPLVGSEDHAEDLELSDLDGGSGDEDQGVIYANQPLWVLPLYSLLPTHKQQRVFKPPPQNCRLCVIATNVAETSLTIPGMKYVIDTGKTKVKLYDKMTGVTTYVVTWTSKASANQRAGRAGRTSPGHCYRLYSSAVFNDVFTDFAPPEIQQKPVDDLYLQMKCMNVDKVVNFPFPTAPDLLQLKSAELRLEILGLLKGNDVTDLGRAVGKFPVLPRYGKMLALSHQRDLLPYTITLVAALSVPEILLETPFQGQSEDVAVTKAKWRALRHHWAGSGNSHRLGDNMVLLKAVGAAEFANSNHKLEQFCHDNGLRHKALLEIRKLRLQLTNEVNLNMTHDTMVTVDPKLAPPTDLQAKLLRQILLSGLGDQVARKVPRDELPHGCKQAYQLHNMSDFVYIHSSSVLKREGPDWVTFNELYESGDKIYIRGLSAIDCDWLPVYVPLLCNLGDVLADPEPMLRDGKVWGYVTGTFGSQSWQLSKVLMEFPNTMDRYKWFGRFLLDGQVFDKLSKFKTSLLSQPVIMIKSWAKLQTRTDAILKALASKQLGTKEALEKQWKSDPKFLLKEYLMWLPQSAHSDVISMWPPLD